MHLSLWRNGENVFMASGGSFHHGMSDVGEEFMAGVLHHLPSILAFTAPVPNRYFLIESLVDVRCILYLHLDCRTIFSIIFKRDGLLHSLC